MLFVLGFHEIILGLWLLAIADPFVAVGALGDKVASSILTPLGCVRPNGWVSVDLDTSDLEMCARRSVYRLAIAGPYMPSQGKHTHTPELGEGERTGKAAWGQGGTEAGARAG